MAPDRRSKLRYLSKLRQSEEGNASGQGGEPDQPIMVISPVENSAPATPVAKKKRLAPSGFFLSTFYTIAENNCTYCYVHVSRFPDFSTGAEYANGGGEASSLE